MNARTKTLNLIRLLLVTGAGHVGAQNLPKTFHACYIGSTGTVYLIQEPGLPTSCANKNQIAFSWIDGLPGYAHGALNGLGNDDHPQYLLTSGARALAGNLGAGGFKITGLGAGTVPGDAVRFEQAVKGGDAAAGDLSGTYPNPTVVRIQGRAIANTVPNTGQLLSWDGSAWAPFTPPSLQSGTPDNTPNTLVERDASGGFAAGGVQLSQLTLSGTAIIGTIRAAAGLRLFTSATGDALTFEGGSGSGCEIYNTPSKYAGNLTCSGPIEAAAGGFRFPDGTIQTTAATSAASGTPDNTPNALVQRDAEGGFAAGSVHLGELRISGGGMVASGTLGFGNIPATGPGVRLLWHPGKAAFRAGYASSTEWDDASVGSYSTAIGEATTASGEASFALGLGTTASGNSAVVMGQYNTASGLVSTAMGRNTIASGAGSTAMGSQTIASGLASTAMGTGTMANGTSSTAMGNSTTASGYGSTAMGLQTTASGDSSTAMGAFTTASGGYSIAMGVRTTSSGSASTAMGTYTTASGDNSTAMGLFASTDSHQGSFVYGDATNLGVITRVTADNSFVVRAQHIWFGTRGDQVATPGRFVETSTGAYLSDGGDWVNASDVNRKDNFRDVDAEAVLQSLSRMPIGSWNYRADAPAVRHFGPTAQDFHAAFHLGSSDRAISTVDEGGVALLGIQALERRTRDQANEIAALRAELVALRAKIDSLARRP